MIFFIFALTTRLFASESLNISDDYELVENKSQQKTFKIISHDSLLEIKEEENTLKIPLIKNNEDFSHIPKVLSLTLLFNENLEIKENFVERLETVSSHYISSENLSDSSQNEDLEKSRYVKGTQIIEENSFFFQPKTIGTALAKGFMKTNFFEYISLKQKKF